MNIDDTERERLRQFIFDRFEDGDLADFCFDYFPEVSNNFTDNMDKSKKVLNLITYCKNRDLMITLHAALLIARPKPYRQVFPKKAEDKDIQAETRRLAERRARSPDGDSQKWARVAAVVVVLLVAILGVVALIVLMVIRGGMLPVTGRATPTFNAVMAPARTTPPTIASPSPRPSTTAPATSAPTSTPTSSASLTPSATETTPEAGLTPACEPNQPQGWTIHRVESGETLSFFSAQCNVSMETILEANCLTTDAVLSVGQEHFLP